MSESSSRLAHPPIVEAILDIDCAVNPQFDLTSLENQARASFAGNYPLFQKQFVEELRIEQPENGPTVQTSKREVQALQFLQIDRKQLVQVRAQGYSFNRLAPYSNFDEYLPEIEATWKAFVELAKPLQIRTIRLRYINRILLPLQDAILDLEQFLKVSPRLPDEADLDFIGFFNQHSARERLTGNLANIVLTTLPWENRSLPLIFDITVSREEAATVEDWTNIRDRVSSLRKLKNCIFWNTLTNKCIELFQHSP